MKGKMEQLEEFSESLQQMHTQDKLALSVLAQEGEDAKKKVSDAEQIINDLRDKIKAN